MRPRGRERGSTAPWGLSPHGIPVPGPLVLTLSERQAGPALGLVSADLLRFFWRNKARGRSGTPKHPHLPSGAGTPHLNTALSPQTPEKRPTPYEAFQAHPSPPTFCSGAASSSAASPRVGIQGPGQILPPAHQVLDLVEDDGTVLPEDFGDAAPLASAQHGDEQKEQNSAGECPGENLCSEGLGVSRGGGMKGCSGLCFHSPWPQTSIRLGPGLLCPQALCPNRVPSSSPACGVSRPDPHN